MHREPERYHGRVPLLRLSEPDSGDPLEDRRILLSREPASAVSLRKIDWHHRAYSRSREKCREVGIYKAPRLRTPTLQPSLCPLHGVLEGSGRKGARGCRLRDPDTYLEPPGTCALRRRVLQNTSEGGASSALHSSMCSCSPPLEPRIVF